MSESIKKGDVLRLEIGTRGQDCMLYVNDQPLNTVNSVELRVAGGERTTIKIELGYPNEVPVIYEGTFTPLEDT
ncbi:MAG: hypothetical protein KAJ19_12225 [Gammaproteobacteria bacterium]|nr:hypothetical protein [Gammaproteobacteria bacterium]